MENRHQFRANWHNYNEGLFFVTLCVDNHRSLFGKINHNAIHLSEIGKIATSLIREIPQHYNQASVLNYVVMPNHIHMKIRIVPNVYICSQSIGCLRESSHTNKLRKFHHNSMLSRIIGSYKSSVTKKCRLNKYQFGTHLWQARFHEHIVKNQNEYEKIMNYIDQNICNWDKDCFYQQY